MDDQEIEKPFACPHCPYRGRRKKLLKCHLRVHWEVKPFQCPHCPYSAKRSEQVKQHARLRHTDPSDTEGKHCCPWCPFKTVNSTSMGSHMRTHTGEKPFECTHPGCQKSFSTNSVMKGHLMTHTNERSHECPVCHQKFKRRTTAVQHRIVVHETVKKFDCPLCPYKAKVKYSLATHTRLMHSDEPPRFKCDQCSFAGKTRTALKSHLVVHPNTAESKMEKRYACTQCPYKGRTASALKTHTRTHTSETPFVCKFCDHFRARSSGHLTYHILRCHTGKEEGHKFKCLFCLNYSTINFQMLNLHMRAHTGERPYKCKFDGCQYAASSGTLLREHQRIHSEERPFKCPFPGCHHTAKSGHSIRIHGRVHLDEAVKPKKQKNTPCPHCPYMCRDLFKLKLHLKNHGGDQGFKCPILGCTYTNVNSTQITFHVRFHHGNSKRRPCSRTTPPPPPTIMVKRRVKREPQAVTANEKRLLEYHGDDGRSKKIKYTCKVSTSCSFFSGYEKELILHHNLDHGLPIVCMTRI